MGGLLHRTGSTLACMLMLGGSAVAVAAQQPPTLPSTPTAIAGKVPRRALGAPRWSLSLDLKVLVAGPERPAYFFRVSVPLTGMPQTVPT